jgi:hypothetical protein
LVFVEADQMAIELAEKTGPAVAGPVDSAASLGIAAVPLVGRVALQEALLADSAKQESS